MEEIRLDRASIDRLIERYEDVRAVRGLGTTFRRVTPGQRLDALQVCVAVAASGLAAGQATKAFWLRHLVPVLAETRDSAIALDEAFDLAFPPPETGTTADPEPSIWARIMAALARWATTFQWIAHPLTAAGVMAVVVLAVALFPHTTDRPVDIPTSDVPYRGTLPDQVPAVDNQGSTPLARAYARVLDVVAASGRGGDPIVVSALAQTLSATFPQVGTPANLLAAMVHRYPLPPFGPVPKTNEGATALRQYAMLTAERLVPLAADDIAALFADDAVAGPDVSAFLAAYAAENLTPRTARADPNGGLGDYRLAPFVIVLLGLAWVVRRPSALMAEAAADDSRAAIIALKEARRAAAGVWADALVVQTGTSGLPPLPPAGRIARRLIGFRDPRPGNRLDPNRSVRATLQSAGDLLAVLRPRSSAVEFVFLVRRRHRHDHERARVLRLVNALSDSGLAVTAYDYAPDPRHLLATARAGLEETRRIATLDLRGLRERHFGAVLVLVTDGEDLLDPLTGRPLDFVGRELATWSRRILLTPTPMAAWGEREYRLALALQAPVARARLAGFADLALAFPQDSGGARWLAALSEARRFAAPADQIAHWRRRMGDILVPDPMPALPPILAEEGGGSLTGLRPPDDVVDAIVLALREWLGHGYTWFLAAAIHPHLRVDLTLWLGAQLTRRTLFAPGSAADGSQSTEVPLYSEDLFERLCQLPWFRQGWLPGWLRKAAFERAREREKTAARAAVDRLLTRSLSDDRRGSVTLPVWLSDWRGQTLRADDVMLGLKSDVPVVPRPLERMSAADVRRRWIAVAIMRLVVLLTWASVAATLVPPPGVPEPNGAWLPLASFVAASLVAVVAASIPAVRQAVVALFLSATARADRRSVADAGEVAS